MHANLAIHALLVAAFLCCFWLMLRPRLGGMSHLRRWALLLTTPYVLLAFMLASPTVFSAFIESVRRLEAVPLALFIILGSGTSSVVCVELARVVVVKARGVWRRPGCLSSSSRPSSSCGACRR